jgi:hypothetical protein
MKLVGMVVDPYKDGVADTAGVDAALSSTPPLLLLVPQQPMLFRVGRQIFLVGRREDRTGETTLW